MNGFKSDKKYLYWGVTAFLVIIACMAFFWIIQRWSGFRGVMADVKATLSPFIMGGAIAYLLTPIVKFFENKLLAKPSQYLFKNSPQRAPAFARGVAIALALIFLIGIIAALFRLVLPQLYSSIESIVLNASGSIERLVAWARRRLDDYPEFEAWFIEFVGDAGTELTNWAKNILMPQMQNIVASVSIGVVSIVKAIINLFVALVVSVYAMYSREKFVAQGKKMLYSFLSVRHVNRVLIALRYTNRAFMDFVTGRLLDASIVAAICYFGCLAIGIKDTVLITVLVGVTNVIPFFGPFIGAIPSALIVLMYSPLKCLIFVIFIIVLQQVDGNIICPRILGSRTGLSGFWVLFALLFCYMIFGPIGMIIGVPLFAVVYAAIRSFSAERLKKRGLPTETDVYRDLDYIDPDSRETVFLVKVRELPPEDMDGSEN